MWLGILCIYCCANEALRRMHQHFGAVQCFYYSGNITTLPGFCLLGICVCMYMAEENSRSEFYWMKLLSLP